MKSLITALLCFISFSFCNTKVNQPNYANKLIEAFNLQAMGYTTMAFYCWKDGYQAALANGEPVAKLKAVESLFVWYRQYGWNTGLLSKPSGIDCEYFGENDERFPKLEPLNPSQSKLINDFLFGVGEVISGVFCICLNPPILGRVGGPLILSGCNFMYKSVSAMRKEYHEKLERLNQLQQIQKRVESVAN